MRETLPSEIQRCNSVDSLNGDKLEKGTIEGKERDEDDNVKNIFPLRILTGCSRNILHTSVAY